MTFIIKSLFQSQIENSCRVEFEREKFTEFEPQFFKEDICSNIELLCMTHAH